MNTDSDSRTPNEIFSALCARMKELSGNSISDEEATRAARRLIGFCETIMQIPSHKHTIPLETLEQAE